MRVDLISWTPEPDRTVAAAARLCYSQTHAAELKEKMSQDTVDSLLDRIAEMGHLSTFEHASFTFAIEGVSRALTHQLVRHRIASYSQQSQRYVSEEAFEYIMPPSIASSPEAAALFNELMGQIREAYTTLNSLVPKEDARYVLPNACETKIVCTFNARSLLNFFSHRCCNRAQWEIRELAYKMLDQVREVAPGLFAHAGPPCEAEGICPEGEMSCGKWKQE
ncbi:MAG TPA: FAD-dependent thymidylate synthase [Clostridia bacterium]|nr:FAD-dependent thymidylate synthase [Clostridia bacterium]